MAFFVKNNVTNITKYALYKIEFKTFNQETLAENKTLQELTEILDELVRESWTVGLQLQRYRRGNMADFENFSIEIWEL